MKAFIFQHVAFESPAAIKVWLTKNNYEIVPVEFYSDFTWPQIEEVDCLIIMGGPMSVNDEAEYSWLSEEKAFVKKCIEAGKKVVGICLGSQIIASALGSKIYPGKQKEIGWFPVTVIENTVIKEKNPVIFHWHGETFDLPTGAKLIASTDVCQNQIFTLGSNVLAMQCHLEMTETAIAGMLKNCASELVDAPFIQTAQEIEEGVRKYGSVANGLLFNLLDSLR